MIGTKRIVVVGGGAEAWLAANCLDAALNDPQRRFVEVCVVGAAGYAALMPAETTRPGFRQVLALAGIDEIDFMRRSGATFNQALKFVAWNEGGKGSFYHPFDRHHVEPLDIAAADWLRSDQRIPFAETVSAQPALCEANMAPGPLPGKGANAGLKRGFHVDSLRLADLFRDIGIARGIEHVPERIVGADVGESGDIAAVLAESGMRIEGDVFVDCTGFEGQLVGECLGVPWIDCSQWLPCDRELGIAVPYESANPGVVRPCTETTAASAGWIREIPLQDRRAWGYAHSGAHISADEALAELCAFVGEAPDDNRIDTLGFPVGYRAKAWAGNCVAIGTAAGFVEPLEATTLQLTIFPSLLLAEHFPLFGDMPPLAYRFNRIVTDRFHEMIDFLNLHYFVAGRRDSNFWRDMQRRDRHRDSLAAKLDFWRHRPPSHFDFEDASLPGDTTPPLPDGGLPGDHRRPRDTGALFGLSAYEALLYGVNFLADACDRWYGTNRPPARPLPSVERQLHAARAQCPPHADWLRQVCGGRPDVRGPRQAT